MDGRFERLAFLYDSIEADLSSMPCRQDGEFLSIGEAVGGEVVVVDREDDGEAFAGSKVDQGGVAKSMGRSAYWAMRAGISGRFLLAIMDIRIGAERRS